MTLTAQVAKHFRDIHFGGNWTFSNLKDQLANVNWQQATTQVHGLNTIAMLTYHINYYVSGVLKVFHGEPLTASDKFSFDCPPIHSEADWQQLLDKMWADASAFANFVEQMPESKLLENLAHEKYGNYYRNIHGIIEHSHYHLGQIAIIKKIILKNNPSAC